VHESFCLLWLICAQNSQCGHLACIYLLQWSSRSYRCSIRLQVNWWHSLRCLIRLWITNVQQHAQHAQHWTTSTQHESYTHRNFSSLVALCVHHFSFGLTDIEWSIWIRKLLGFVSTGEDDGSFRHSHILCNKLCSFDHCVGAMRHNKLCGLNLVNNIHQQNPVLLCEFDTILATYVYHLRDPFENLPVEHAKITPTAYLPRTWTHIESCVVLVWLQVRQSRNRNHLLSVACPLYIEHKILAIRSHNTFSPAHLVDSSPHLQECDV